MVFVAQLALAKPLVDAAMTLMALDAWYSRMAGIEPDSPVMSFFNTYFNDDLWRNVSRRCLWIQARPAACDAWDGRGGC